MRSRRRRSSPRMRRGRAMGSMGDGTSGVLLGTLDELVIQDDAADAITVSKAQLRGWYLAWLPGHKALACVRKTNARPGRLSAASVKTHRDFHNSAPRKAVAYEWPDPVGACRTVGLLQGLTYVVPPTINSPEKRGYRWVHAFGDHGESGHGPMNDEPKVYSPSLMPALLVDKAGNLYIKRRPGNKYNVTKWIFW